MSPVISGVVNTSQIAIGRVDLANRPPVAAAHITVLYLDWTASNLDRYQRAVVEFPRPEIE